MPAAAVLSKLCSLPNALKWWSALGAHTPLRGARILTLHGTPPRLAAQLRRQLRYLRRCFRVVPLPWLAQLLRNPRARVDGMVALTFDDGLRSNVTVAYPLLAEMGLPATFFVCPGLIDEGAWLWTHEARLRLRWLEVADAEPILERMKRMPLAERRLAEDELRCRTPQFARDWADHEECDLATWDELRRLDPRIVNFGSHSLTHPILKALDAETLEDEVGESRRLLEARLQHPVELFAYPNGDHDAAARERVRAHYRAAVITAAQSIEPGVDPCLLPRLNTPLGALRLALRMHRTTPVPTPLLGELRGAC